MTAQCPQTHHMHAAKNVMRLDTAFGAVRSHREVCQLEHNSEVTQQRPLQLDSLSVLPT
jgi:hypothetical protein